MKKFKLIFKISIIIILVVISIIELKTMNCDKKFHLERLEQLASEIKINGILKYPYYINFEAFGGLGYATETFYGDVLLIIPALLINLGINVNIVYTATIVFSILLIFISMYYAYIFFNKDKKNAFTIAYIYTFSNYILFEIVERNALGTNFAYVFLPWVIFSTIKILNNNNIDKRNIIILGISMAGMIISHIQTTVITIIGLIIYIMCNLKQLANNTKCIKSFMLSATICICIDAFYIIPMIEQSLFQKLYVFNNSSFKLNNTILSLLNIICPNYVWRTHITDDIILRNNTMINNILRFWSLPSCFMPVIYLIISIFNQFIKQRNIMEKKIIIVSFAISAFTIISSFTSLICNIKFVSFLQFPWRLLTISTIFLPLSFVLINKNNEKSKIIAVLLTMINALIYLTFFAIYDNNQKWEYDLTIGAGEYLPIEVPNAKYGYDLKNDIDITYSKEGYLLNYDNYNLNYGDIIELPVVYYKGYTVYCYNNEKEQYEKNEFYKSENGLISIKYKNKKIKIKYTGTVLQKLSKYLSSIFISILLMYILRWKFLESKRNSTIEVKQKV